MMDWKGNKGFYSWTVGSCDGWLERRTVGRICEIDKQVARTCKGTNMGRWGAVGQGGNRQWYLNNESQSLYEKDPVSEGSTNFLCIK